MPASSGLFRSRGLAQPCSAFPGLLQLTPARPGPRSLAQLPRGPGRVPVIQGASQRSYRAQEPWQCPGMCPGGAHGHIYLQPIGTVPRLKKQCLKTPGKTLSWTFYFFYLTFKSKSLVFHICATGSQPYWILTSCQPCLFTNCISCQPYWFYNLTQLWQFNCEMKLKVNLWLDYSYFVSDIGSYTLFPIDFNGKPEILLKHLKKNFFFLKACVCVIGLWLFFRIV